jgi:hypothetical protein
VSCVDFATYTIAFAIQLRKITENLSYSNRKAPGLLAPNAIRSVDFAIEDDCFDCLLALLLLSFASSNGVNH